ncbi:MAG: PorV/PorQ family protein [Elusimicrobiales bacterium]
MVIRAAAILAALAAPAFCGEGTTPAAWLEIDPSARSAAMGGAYSALGDDVFSFYHNPAGLAFMSAPQAALSRVSWVEDMGSSYAAFAAPAGDFTLGLGGGYFSSGAIERMDGAGNNLGTYGYSSYSAGGALAFRRGNIAAGAALKYVGEKMDDYGAGAPAADIGAVYTRGPVSLAAALRDWGGSIALYNESAAMKGSFRGGAAVRLFGNALALAGEMERPLASGAKPRYCAGGEYAVSESAEVGKFYLRAGWQFSRDEGMGGGLSAGVGLLFSKKYTLDYAYVPMGDFGSAQRFSLKVDFGGGKPQAAPRRTESETYKSADKAVEDYRSGKITLDQLRAILRSIGF